MPVSYMSSLMSNEMGPGFVCIVGLVLLSLLLQWMLVGSAAHASPITSKCRADLGTGDELGLDVLINMLSGCSEDYVGVKQLIVGGENEDWPVDDELKPEVCLLSAKPMGTLHNKAMPLVLGAELSNLRWHL